MKRLAAFLIGLVLLAPSGAGANMLGINRANCAGGTVACAFVPNAQGVYAPIFANFVSGKFYYNGTSYSSYSAYSTGIGGTFARACTNCTATDLLPSAASGASYSTYSDNVARINSNGYLVEGSRVQQLLNSASPATQTTGSLGTGTYTLWVNGSGSAAMSSGTGTGCGTGTATNGTPVNFTITGAGTCTVTVTGSLNAFQLEAGAFGSSFIITTASTGTRAQDLMRVTLPISGVTLDSTALTQLYKGTILANAGSAWGLFSITDTNSTNIVELGQNGLATTGLVISGGSTSASLTSGVGVTVGTPYGIGLLDQANNFALVTNGSDIKTDTSGSVQATLSQFNIGFLRTNFQQNAFSYVRYYGLWSGTSVTTGDLSRMTVQ